MFVSWLDFTLFKPLYVSPQLFRHYFINFNLILLNNKTRNFFCVLSLVNALPMLFQVLAHFKVQLGLQSSHLLLSNSEMKMTSPYISFSFVIFRRRPSLASAGCGLQLLQNALVKIRHEAYIETIAIITKISRVYLKLPTYLQLKFCDIFVFYTYSIYSFIPFPQVGCVKIQCLDSPEVDFDQGHSTAQLPRRNTRLIKSKQHHESEPQGTKPTFNGSGTSSREHFNVYTFLCCTLFCNSIHKKRNN